MRTGFFALLGIVGFTAAIVVLILWSAGVSVFAAHVNARLAKATLNSKVTAQVFQPNNKLQSQGYFETLDTDFKGFLEKIVIQKQTIAAPGGDSPYNQANLNGLKLLCVDTVEHYNAAALSISSQAFRSADLPPTLDATKCG